MTTPEQVARAAAWRQFKRMSSSNAGDYAGHIVQALRNAGLLNEQPERYEQVGWRRTVNNLLHSRVHQHASENSECPLTYLGGVCELLYRKVTK